MSKILIVYYSLSGVTKQVVDLLAHEIDATVIPIEEPSKRSGFFGYMRSGFEALTRGEPEVRTRMHEPARFPVTVLASPVWAGKMCSPMRSYIASRKGEFRDIALLATMGGSGGRSTIADMADAAGKEPVTTLFLRERQVRARAVADDVTEFARKIEAVIAAG